jgi:hypothetical protein
VVVVKRVPAQDCEEYTLDQATLDRVIVIGEDAVTRRAEIEVVGFAA